jgi:hypothetical protein
MEDIMSRFRFPFTTPLLVAALALPFIAACDEDPVEPDEHAEELAEVRLTVGSQTLTINEGGAQGDLTIPNGPSSVTATFLAGDGDAVTLDGEEFEIRLNTQNAAIVTFTRTGPFAGTLTGVADGSAVVAVSVFHKEEGHDDFGPFNVNVTVQ